MGFESVLSTTENVGTQCPDNRVNENQCFYCLDTKEVLSIAENMLVLPLYGRDLC